MRNTLFELLGPQLARLEQYTERAFPMGEVQFLAAINDFGSGRLRVYVSDRSLGQQRISVTLAASDIMRMLRRRTPVLPDKSELQALKIDLGLDERSFQGVSSAISFIENHLTSARKGLADPSLSFEVDSRTAWCLANCPGQSTSSVQQFQPDFYLSGLRQETFSSTATLMSDLSKGEVLFGVRLAETMTMNRVSVKSFIENALEDLPSVPHMYAIGDPADVLSDLILERCFVRDLPVQIFVPLFDATFLTGVLVVNLAATRTALKDCGASVRSEIVHFLFGAATDLTRAVFFGRQRIAMETLGRGIPMDGTVESLSRLTRVLKLAQPILACTPCGDDQLSISYQPRYLPSGTDPNGVSLTVTTDPASAHVSPASRGTPSHLTLLAEQISHILQYNRMLHRERREVIKWVSHTVAGRLADLGRCISAAEPSSRVTKSKFDAVNTIFDAARYLGRGEKYRPLDIVPFNPKVFGAGIAEYLIGECSHNRRLIEALRKAILWEVFHETLSFDQAQERLSVLATNRDLFTITSADNSDGSPIRTSTSILYALLQEITLNALEYNDWQRTPWTPVVIHLDGRQGEISVTNAVAASKIARIQALKLGFDQGDTVAMSLGLTLVSELYSPVVCRRSYFELHTERAPDGAGVVGSLTFGARLKAL